MKQSLRYFKNIFERNISLWLSEKWNNIYEKLWINSNDVKKIDKDTLFKLRKENPVLAKKQDDEVKEVNNNFNSARQEISKNTQKNIWELKQELPPEPKLEITSLEDYENLPQEQKQKIQEEAVRTKEEITTVLDTFWSAVDKEKWMEEIDMPSFNELITKNSPENVYQDVLNHFKNKVNSKWDLVLSLFHIGNWWVFDKYWYKGKWFFWLIWFQESTAFVSMVKDIANTQRKINSLSPQDKMEIMLDFSWDWVLDNKVNFNSVELDALKAIQDKKTFDRVISNLGLEPANFDQMVNKNYYSARLEFKKRLADFLSAPQTSARQLLLPKDKFQNSMEFLATPEEAKVIDWEFDNIEKTDPRISEIAKKEPDIWKEVRNRSFNLVVWDVKWWAISLDSVWKKVSEITKWLLDTVSFGFVDWKPWVVIWGSKQINDRVTVAWWMTNFVPFIWWSVKLTNDKIKDLKRLFPSTMDSKIWAWVWATANVLWVWWWLDIYRLNEKNSAWIKEMVNAMDWLLDTTLDNIISGKTFEQSWLENEVNTRQAYERLASMYKAMWANPNLKWLIKSWALTAYRDSLFANAKWLNVNKVSIWILWPMLAFWIWWEYITQKYVDKDTSRVDSYIDSIDWLVEWWINKKFSSFDAKAIELTRVENDKLSRLITAEVAKRPGMKQLSEQIHNLLNWNWDINQTWDKLWKELWVKIPDTYNDSQKMLILQNVAINLMKKPWLKVENGTVSLDKWLTVEKYDAKHWRATFFDNIFKKEVPDIANSIKSARQEYYKKYWDVNNFQIWQLWLEDGISFSWVQSGKARWLNPYVVWHIAEFGWERWKVKISEKSQFLVNKLPDHITASLISQLESVWYEFKSSDKSKEIKSIINNWWTGDIKIDYDLYFTKDPECLNDKILMDLKLQKQWEEIKVREWNTYKAENDVNSWWVTYMYDRTKPEKPEETPPPSTPEETPPPSTPEETPPPSTPERPRETPPPDNPPNTPEKPWVKTTPGNKENLWVDNKDWTATFENRDGSKITLNKRWDNWTVYETNSNWQPNHSEVTSNSLDFDSQLNSVNTWTSSINNVPKVNPVSTPVQSPATWPTTSVTGTTATTDVNNFSKLNYNTSSASTSVSSSTTGWSSTTWSSS